MTENEFENTNGPALSQEQREYLITLMETLRTIVNICNDPLDSKVLALLEVSYDIIDQQLKLDISHEWGPAVEISQAMIKKNSNQKFLFLEDDDLPPSADELEKWLKE